MAGAIKVENLSKIYRLGEIGTGSIGQDVDRWFKTKILKQEDPFFKIGEANDRTAKGTSDIVYSLKDINFEIEQGDAVGIIGRNGAGKSTLLKILSRVTSPTTGKINIKGRVASLLEVGTGFHPELTGRENIYLNGAILGMRKKEIDRKFDEIVDFSGVERYIDTPVKRYSSGMYVRLAFAVAAHLESEILIVDEVLAVGDAEFQKKCLGKMNDVNHGEGKTILFVSHNMAAIRELCNNGIILGNGSVIHYGDINNCINSYLSNNSASKFEFINNKKQGTQIKEFRIVGNKTKSPNLITDKEIFFLEIIIINEKNKDLNFGLTFYSQNGVPIFSKSILDDFTKIEEGEVKYILEMPISLLLSGMYFIEGALWDSLNVYDKSESFLAFEYKSDKYLEKKGGNYRGFLYLNNKWIHERY